VPELPGPLEQTHRCVVVADGFLAVPKAFIKELIDVYVSSAAEHCVPNDEIRHSVVRMCRYNRVPEADILPILEEVLEATP